MRPFSKVFLVITFVSLITIAYNDSAMPSETFILDLYMGEPVPADVMLDDLASTRIIYLGEIHTIHRHHELQAKILRDLSARQLKLALGMEMFSHEQQAILDRWQKGKEDVSALIRALGHEGWTNLKDYEAVLVTAHELGIPILGLNASDKLVKKVAREGFGNLTRAEKEQLPNPIEKVNPLLDRLLRLRLKVHRAFEGRSLDSIVEAQSLRDQTMAQNLNRYLESPDGRDRSMIVIAGSGHMNYGFGIPERAHHLNGLPFRIILPTESGQLVLSEEEKRQSIPINVTHEDLRFLQVPIADYLHVIPLQEPKEPEDGALRARFEPGMAH
jgi:uncharacterized iron-regulated protein